ncbi:MAG: hypothetical protein LAT67_00590 [Balneolales bacterium]|nr:hypothetical protein [Balneolales bacterium]
MWYFLWSLFPSNKILLAHNQDINYVLIDRFPDFTAQNLLGFEVLESGTNAFMVS